jgi:hypothetical protein
VVLGDKQHLLAEARFRRQGDIHQSMYDPFSLGEFLKSIGFRDVFVKTALDSAIPERSAFRFRLDGENGHVRKPDALFLEARK